MPISVPWNAPEHHDGHFKPEQAKQMDIFSFGMVFFWLPFAAGSLGNLPPPPNTVLESGQTITFNTCEPEKNLLQLWKRDYRLVEWVSWIVYENVHLNSSAADHLKSFFQFTLALDPKVQAHRLRIHTLTSGS